MTTGRINQVTILYLGAEARRHDPRKGGMFQEGSRIKQLQPPASIVHKAPTLQAINSIAPTEIPQGAVRNGA